MSKNMSRAISRIVLAIFGFVIFCSSAFLILHTYHDCTGEDCSVCMELAECHKMLHALGTATAGASRLIPMLCIAAAICKAIIRSHSAHTTLISLKVELLY